MTVVEPVAVGRPYVAANSVVYVFTRSDHCTAEWSSVRVGRIGLLCTTARLELKQHLLLPTDEPGRLRLRPQLRLQLSFTRGNASCLI